MGTFAGTERYELLNKLGQGGMGTVYSVFDRRRQRKVALKVLSNPDTGGLFRFKREFRAVADLRHPNLIRLYDLGVLDDGGFFFTMELIEGQDLTAWVRRKPQEVGVTVKAMAETIDESGATQTWGGPPPEASDGRVEDSEIARVLTGVSSGLAFLHRLRKVHRDLKPSNVMVDESGRSRLLDFGILRELDREGLTMQGAVGTPLYMAPEQVAGDDVTPAADIYSLGCLLYQLLTGSPPFTGRPTRILMGHMREEPTPPSRLRQCDPNLERLCLQLLDKVPESRPTAEQVVDRLWDIVGDAGPPATQTSTDLVPVPVPGLLGRDVELGRLEAIWEEAHQEPRIVLIAGESGAGKSALAAELAARLQDRVPVWFGGCYEREHVPYKAFDAVVDAAAVELLRRGDDAFRHLPPGIPALARLFPVLREVPAIQKADDETPLRDPRAERQRAGKAFFALLQNLSNGEPPILIIDDLQRSDIESLDVLKWVARLPAANRCMIVGTYRSEEVDAEHPLMEVFEETNRVTRLDLPPLGQEASEELARACAASTLSETQLHRLIEDAQGNPFLVVELARASRELDGEALPTITELVSGRLARLGDEARRVLEAAAIAGGRVAFEELIDAADLPPAPLADAVDELLRVQLLREVQAHHGGEDAYDLMHDRLREAVYVKIDQGRRAELHALLAATLAQRGEAARAVEHWRLAGDQEKAQEAALTAAQIAEEKLAFDQAAGLYELASRDGAEWPLAVAHARALAKAGRHGEAAVAFERAARIAPRGEARELHLEAATERLAAGDVAGGMQGLDGILRQLGTTIQRSFFVSLLVTSIRVTLLVIRWWIYDLRCRLDPTVGKTREPLDPDTAFRLRVFDTTHRCLAIARPLEAARFGTRHAMLACSTYDPLHHGRARINFGLFLIGEKGSVAGRWAMHHLTIGEALCAEENDSPGLLHAHLARSFYYLLSSNWGGVRRISGESEALARKAGLYGDPTLMVIENIHLASELFRGDLHHLLRTAELYLTGARVRGNVWGLAWPLSMRGYILLFMDQLEQAQQALDEALAVTPAEPLTVIRVHVELQALGLDLYREDAEAAWAKLTDLDRRWRESGLIASTMENSSFRLMEERTRLLLWRQGKGTLSRCRLSSWIHSFLPPPTSIRDEMLRLEAARAYLQGFPRKALKHLDRGIFLAESRNNVFGLGLMHMARAHVRQAFGHPGAEYDRQRGQRFLKEIGAPNCYTLRIEGWEDPAPARKCRLS